ncbi:hypothetical protein [Aminiphilus sp.]|uniref:hypothetical protein n=1 Tax=Aminiphilus sp. TaxID=1872488 RepID=UPI00260E2035|nr:hypothetical protein [Aminiphilus sp.]
MPVLRHIPLTFTAEAILRIAGGARTPRSDAPASGDAFSSGETRRFSPERQEKFRPLAEEMRVLALACAAPAVAWERYALESAIPETGTVTLCARPLADPRDDEGDAVPPKGGGSSMPEQAEGDADGDGTPRLSLFLGESATYLEGAAYVFAAVTTIGPELERRLAAFEAEGDLLRAYFLDAAGVLALERASAALRRLARDCAAGEGRSLSPTLLPGSAPGWSVEGQEALLRLAGGDRLGITITEGAMLRPLMSGSFLLGVGDFEGKKHPATLCTGCARYETCLWRQVEDVAEEPAAPGRAEEGPLGTESPRKGKGKEKP